MLQSINNRPRPSQYSLRNIEMNLALRDEVSRAELNYLDEKEFPKAKSASVKEYFDTSFVENLEKSGFFASTGFARPK